MNAQVPAPTPDAAGATPVMAQFFEAKARQPDALVFFRMGDFYELFFEDAQKAAAALGITLTARGTHGGAPIPMAGVPAHAVEAYLAKLIRAGFKVAVCEQLEDPAEAKKRGGKSIVRRDLVRVVTPGTLTEDGYPYVTPLWYEYDGSGYILIGRERADWIGHIRRDPRVGLCIDDPVSRSRWITGITTLMTPARRRRRRPWRRGSDTGRREQRAARPAPANRTPAT